MEDGPDSAGSEKGKQDAIFAPWEPNPPTETHEPEIPQVSLWQFPRAEMPPRGQDGRRAWSDPGHRKILVDVGGNLVETVGVALPSEGVYRRMRRFGGEVCLRGDIATGNLIREISGFELPSPPRSWSWIRTTWVLDRVFMWVIWKEDVQKA